MGFRLRIKFFLVHTLNYSNKEAQKLIDTAAVEIDNTVIHTNCLLSPQSEIRVHQQLVRPKTEFVYLKFYKPVGFQSSLHASIANNLSAFFTAYPALSIAGRLDQQSEGLLLLSNDGRWVESICNPESEKEKEYLVGLHKKVSAQFVADFKGGVKIGGYTTKPCECQITGENEIKVILTEGKNRQIRRMCKALGYDVLSLKRVRIAGFALDQMVSGQVLAINSALLHIWLGANSL